MHRGKMLLLLAALGLMPTAADAKPSIVRMMTAPLRMVAPGLPGLRIGHRGRHHRKVAHARHHKSAVARAARRGAPAAAAAPAAPMADQDGQTSGVAQGQDAAPARGEPVRAEPGWAGPVYWPHASDDLFDYVFRAAGERFWARGGRDLADAILMRDSKAEGAAELCGGRQEGDVSAWQEPIAQAVQPNDAQRGAFDTLKSALAEASRNIKNHCPAAKTAASPTQRLDAMTDRIWGMRQAVVLMRAPLEKFSNTLDEQQKTRFGDAIGERHDSSADPGAASAWMHLCADPTAAMTPWPNEQIERRVRPSNEQRQNFQTLQMTTRGMAQQLMASCPKAPPVTALERLDAAEKRLNAMLYAARMVGPALRAFYDSLSPEQKTRFTAVGGESRTSRR